MSIINFFIVFGFNVLFASMYPEQYIKELMFMGKRYKASNFMGVLIWAYIAWGLVNLIHEFL